LFCLVMYYSLSLHTRAPLAPSIGTLCVIQQPAAAASSSQPPLARRDSHRCWCSLALALATRTRTAPWPCRLPCRVPCAMRVLCCVCSRPGLCIQELRTHNCGVLWNQCPPVKESMATENAAKPAQPAKAAPGPPAPANAAPVRHPPAAPLPTSWRPRYFSTTHSTPEKMAVARAQSGRHSVRHATCCTEGDGGCGIKMCGIIPVTIRKLFAHFLEDAPVFLYDAAS
jgi:hypothetical protein